MIKYLIFTLLLIILNNCSFDTKSGIWTKEKEIKDFKLKNDKIKNLFEKKKENRDEFNSELKIVFNQNELNQNPINNNNFGALKSNFNLEKISKFKFKKIRNFDEVELKMTFFEGDLIFFDKNGSIIRFDDSSKIIWKTNNYSKREKKINPILKITKYGEKLLITDSLAKIYLLDAITGKIIWKNEHDTSFVSQIKIDENKFYALDSNNKFNCFSLIDGKKLWDFTSEKRLINSQKDNSIILDDKNVSFTNSKGDIVSLDKENGDLLWIIPTISFDETFQSYLVKNSNLVLNNRNIYFSNNNNSFYSIDANSGLINWRQDINSSLTPLIIDNYILTISSAGYLYILDKEVGNIIRVTDILKRFKEKKRKKIIIKGFVATTTKAYISTNQGHVILYDLENGNVEKIYRLSRSNISRPFVNNDKLYFIKDSEIIMLK